VARDSGRSASLSFAVFRGVMYVLNTRCPRMGNGCAIVGKTPTATVSAGRESHLIAEVNGSGKESARTGILDEATAGTRRSGRLERARGIQLEGMAPGRVESTVSRVATTVPAR